MFRFDLATWQERQIKAIGCNSPKKHPFVCLARAKKNKNFGF
jgi:hypothetical protein